MADPYTKLIAFMDDNHIGLYWSKAKIGYKDNSVPIIDFNHDVVRAEMRFRGEWVEAEADDIQMAVIKLYKKLI